MTLWDLYKTLFVSLPCNPPELPIFTMVEESYKLYQVSYSYSVKDDAIFWVCLEFRDDIGYNALNIVWPNTDAYYVERMYTNEQIHVFLHQVDWYQAHSLEYTIMLRDILINKFLTKDDISSWSMLRLSWAPYIFRNKSGVRIQWRVF